MESQKKAPQGTDLNNNLKKELSLKLRSDQFKIFLHYVYYQSFKKLDTFSQLSQLQTLRDDTRLRKWTVGEKAGNRFPLAGVFS